jgi:spore coat protein U-like protein
MRKTVFLLASLFVMACGIQSVKAQTASASASASANATIITPIAITHEGKPDLNFGNIVAGTATGTVTVDTEGNRTSSTGITLPNATLGTVKAAEFTVKGLANATYAITLPKSINISTTGGETMTVDKFTSNPSRTGTLAGGTQTLSVGARLNVGAGQVAGDYTGEFSVTVAYN